MRTVLLMLTLILGGGRALNAEDLHFENPDQRIKPTANADDVYAMFRFTNVGKKPLTISTVRPTCGCTTTTLDKTTYQPGESGEISVDFSLGDHSGEQDKVIEVYHDNAPPQLLHLRVTLPSPPSIEPGFLGWKRHDDRIVKEVSISLSPGSPYSFIAAVPSSPLVTAELIPTTPGQWTLRVTPTSTSVPGNAMIELRTTTARKFYVFVTVIDALAP